MVLSTEWSQVEIIDLVNDGSGLGFGIVGGRSTGVVIKSILPGGIADKDSRLQSGDHILQIGEVHLRGLAADQVATVLRQAGAQVRMVVARPVEPSSSDFRSLDSNGPIVPTKILNDPDELDRHLQLNGYSTCFSYSNNNTGDSPSEGDRNLFHHQQEKKEELVREDIICDENESNRTQLIDAERVEISFIERRLSNSLDISTVVLNHNPNNYGCNNNSVADNEQNGYLSVNVDENYTVINSADIKFTLPETERFVVELRKDEYGLGITVAGYVCEREDLSGIFIKSLSEGSDAHKCGKIQPNDRIIEVDGQSLQGLTNHEAVEKLKSTGSTVKLTLERYLRGPKFERLQEALAVQHERLYYNKDSTNSPTTPPSVTTLSWIPIESAENQTIEPEGVSLTAVSINSDDSICDHGNHLPQQEQNEQVRSEAATSAAADTKEIFIEEDFEANLDDDLETATKRKWERIIGTEAAIIVANLTKLKGLGISLEGTVDVEGGIELRPHHYIRSILPEGPVGLNGKLNSGDELLEVNGQKLLGIRHVDVVKILKELPSTVRLVCARKHEENRVINTSQDRAAFEARNILGGSLKNLLPQPAEQRLLKALSDTSINTSSTATVASEASLQRAKSRSLEAVTNFAMWSEDVEYVELIKGDRGLGFSILDYQDPLDPQATVIVVRSLVPNGVAEQDGRITPGDRLMCVNDKTIKNATLDQAVQALKCTLVGSPVKLGIVKPLPGSPRTSETLSGGGIGNGS